MDARLNYQGNAVAMKFVKYLISAGKVVSDSAITYQTRRKPAAAALGKCHIFAARTALPSA